ncbi:hypothetical protein C0V76_11785 [Uliginosibacterium sp. TH139]|nr:hypothetical protein C0V76_11785 [Uliginosibacterium sp. TH139]
MACTKLEAGPAAATHSISALGLRKRPKSTGTGLAQPNGGKLAPVMAFISTMPPGTSKVPTGSICLRGFSVIRPIMCAVGSPNIRAT